MIVNVSFLQPPQITYHHRCGACLYAAGGKAGGGLEPFEPHVSSVPQRLFFYFHRLLTHNCFFMLYNHLNRSCSWQHGRERSCVGRRSRMGDTAGICGWWNDNVFIWHKLGFNMNLGYGTCCGFNLCKYDGGDFLTWEQTCVSESNSRTYEWGM
jgi:hypothetical protein